MIACSELPPSPWLPSARQGPGPGPSPAAVACQRGCSRPPRATPEEGESSVQPVPRASKQHQEAQQCPCPQEVVI